MLSFLFYEAKVAVALLVFYLFYRFLLKKETFHRFNRAVLVGTAVLSFLLPLCIITIHRPVEMETTVLESVTDIPGVVVPMAEKATPWWPLALAILFWAGAAFVLVRVILSMLSITKIVRQGELVREEDGCKIFVTDRDIEPFSWMRYIVLSRLDWEGNEAPILAHEKAHIGYRHSVELLLVDILSAFQWFNPAIWMLRADLRELHEYEADDAVLRSGADLKEYQYLLIRKAVGKSGYSVANSFNHSILKNRITMMSKSRSPLSRGWRALGLLPLVCLAIGLQAQTVYEPQGPLKNGESKQEQEQNPPMVIRREAWGEEKEISLKEAQEIDQSRVRSQEKLTYADAKEKYGEKAVNGVLIYNMKLPQELDEIVVITYEDDGPIPFQLLIIPDTMPKFQGADMQMFSRWLNERLRRPAGCKHTGEMRVAFTVDTEGNVHDVHVTQSICEALDAMVVPIIEKSPKWEPALKDGKPVAQVMRIPITFQMR